MKWSVVSELLSVSERHAQQRLAGFREEGPASLAHGNRGQPSRRRLNEALHIRGMNLAKTTYAGVNTCHLVKLLEGREPIAISRSSLQRILREAGLTRGQRRRKQHR